MRNKWLKYWREDSFLSVNGTILKYDKLEHGLLGFIGMFASLWLVSVHSVQMTVLLFVIWNIVGLLWELFQLFVQRLPIETKDLAANNVGIVLAGLLGFLIF